MVLPLPERQSKLDQTIRQYIVRGYAVTSQGDTSAQLIKPKKFDSLAGCILMLMGWPYLLYVLDFSASSDLGIYIDVQPNGHITVTESGRKEMATPLLLLIGFAINAICAVCIWWAAAEVIIAFMEGVRSGMPPSP